MNKKGISAVSLAIAVVVLIILISTVSVSITYSVANAKKRTFAEEIYNIQSLVTEYIQRENTLPVTTNSIQIVPSDLTQFSEETFVDNKLELKVLDLTELEIKNSVYGNKTIGNTDTDKAKDVYAVSEATGKVYYIAGFKSEEKTYYTLTDELLKMVDRNQDLLISEDNITFTPSKVGWSNEGVYVKVTVPTDYEVTSFVVNNTNISYTTEIVDNVTYYNVNVDKVVENYTVTVNYTKDGTAGTVEYATKIDTTVPVISKDENVANTTTAIKGLNAIDNESGIKYFKYVEGAFDITDVKAYITIYGKNINKGSIKFENEAVYTIYAEDKAGNGIIMYVDKSGEITDTKPEDENYPVIPEGFTVSIYEGEKTVKEGLVIYETDSLEGITQADAMETYNQYVWIPVSDISKFVRRDGYANGSLQTYVSSGNATEPFSKGTLTETNDLTGEYAEYAKMVASVEKNGGFYIARYEAGDGTTDSARTQVTNEETDKRTVVSKKNAYVYNYVPWGESMESVAQFTKNSVENVAGAVALSRSVYPESSDKEVVSTLCYGVQRDAVMNFMKDVENPTVEGKKYIEDSTNMGWYSNNYSSGNAEHKTGIDVNVDTDSDGEVDLTATNKVKNIYDMAGNVYECTMEANSTSYRVIRGGAFDSTASLSTAFYRNSSTPTYVSGGDGFRFALYLK